MSWLPGRLVVSQANSLVRLLPGCARAAAGVGLRRDRRVTAHLAKTALFHSYTIIMLYCYDAIIGLSREELTSGQDRTGG